MSTGNGEEYRDNDYNDHCARQWWRELKYNTQLVNENKMDIQHAKTIN
jgi:hypothetical protein